MSIARPTIAEERWLLLAERYPALRGAAESLGHGGDWKTTTRLSRVLGFLLGLFGISLLGGALALFPAPWLIGGVMLVSAAEWLVAKRRVFRSGIEEALYLCGAVAIVVQLLDWSNGSNDAAGVALVATAILLVGWRLLNPLFTTLALMGYSLAIALAGARFFDAQMNTLQASIACAVLAAATLMAGGRTLQRPAHDRMLDGIVIVMPWLAWGWLTAYGWRSSTWLVASGFALSAIFFVVNMTVGVKRRQHAPLISALGSLVCVAYSLHELLPRPLHWEMLQSGGMLLLVAVTLDRMLRHREEGITSRAQEEIAGLDLVQLAGAAHLTPAPVAAPAGVQGQGGEFGGGGASGRF